MVRKKIGLVREPGKRHPLHALILVAASASLGCTADQNRVIEPRSFELSAESVAEYESEKQSMISARD